MPRFENEGFNKNRNSKDIDRTVPENENYYGYSPIDLEFNNKSHTDNEDYNIVRDNQKRGANHYYNDEKEPERFMPEHFTSESIDDFDRTPANNKASSNNRVPTNSRSRNISDGRNTNNRRSNRRSAGKKGALSLRKRILLVILAIIVLLVGSVFPILARIDYDEKKDSQYVKQSELANSSLIKNILLLGVDARSNDKAEASRSDTMMLVSLDMKHHCIKLVSFLRDTWVYIPSIDNENKLNAACSNGGYQNVIDTIEYNFGVNIDGYVVTDFEMFKVLVDSLGGVEVDVTKAEAKEVTNHKKRYGNVTLESGKNMLTGEQALAYCRIRYIDTDFVRTERQRTVISAIFKKALRSNPVKLYKMAFNSAPYIETNLSKGELMWLVARAGASVTGGIYQEKVPFEGTWEYASKRGMSAIAINTEKNKEMLTDYIYNTSKSELKAQEKED